MGNQSFLIFFLIVLVGFALLWKLKSRSSARGRGKPAAKIQEVRFWKKVNPDSNLDVTLIETSSGWQLLDESDAGGNGVVTVYGGPEKPTKTMRCYSLVRKSATIYNRRNYERLKTDCVRKYSSVKEDFDKEANQVLSLSLPPRAGFEGIMDYLKANQVVKG